VSIKLIINGDDFGLTSSINRGIVEAHRCGMLASTSLMASGEAFEEACDLASKNPQLDTGVHLTLDEERPVLSGKEIPTLLGPNGRFHARTSVIQRLVTRKLRLSDVEREWSAQIERCLSHGVRVSHLDSHGHIHCFPALARIAEKLRRFYGIGCLRKPRERMLVRGFRAGWRGYIKKTLVSGCAISSLRSSQLPERHRVGNFLGLAPSGRVDADTLWALFTHVRDGVNEVMLHPGYADQRTCTLYGHWKYQWEDELSALLTVAKDRARLDERGITLTNFAREYSIGD